MPIWRLSPVNLSDPNWLASSHRGAVDAKLTNTKDPLFDHEVEIRFQRLAQRIERWENEDHDDRSSLGHGR